MAKYKNFTGNTSNTVLLAKHINIVADNVIRITCTHDSTDLIVDRLYLDDGTNEYDIIANVKVPVGTSLLLDEIPFDYRLFDLKITTTNASNCTIMIT